MKNIHILPTDKRSKLATKDSNNKLEVSEKNTLFVNGFGFTTQNIYITFDEEIKEGDWCLDLEEYSEQRENTEDVFVYRSVDEDHWDNKKIILTTDQDLIKDGVQAIDDEFLEWFVKNPSCEEVGIEGHIYKGQDETEYKIIIPKEEETKCYCGHTTTCDCGPEEVKQETLEKATKEYVNGRCTGGIMERALLSAIEFGVKWQQERSYSEEEVMDILLLSYSSISDRSLAGADLRKWFEQFKKK